MQAPRIRQNSACCCSPLFSADVMPQVLENFGFSVEDFATLMNDVNTIIKRNNPFTPRMWMLMGITIGVFFCPMKKRLQINTAEVNDFLDSSTKLNAVGLRAVYFPPNGRHYGYIEFIGVKE
uniref:Uncharacterized protein n=1 Tax=Chaetoceros debilis TaxID=122233 RepID=A0A6S8TN55_9STRA|mmetsp:Transcript_2492/g.3702  ORF Transcript_2492/g.3702 Transcript_2492/m.3702 type:complete len:122 (-) Transcript_2492:305-670(-)